MHTVPLLCLAALSTSALITCHPIQKETIRTDLTRENLSNMETMISTYGYFLMMTFSKRMRKAISRESKAALLKKRSKDCFLLLHIKTNNIMCLDRTKNTYISVHGINKDCFKTIDGKNSHHALCPWRSDAMIKLVGGKSHTEAYSAQLHHSLQSNNHKTHRRQRRSQYIDPSDPLGSENPRSRTANHRRPNREHEHECSSNVSKETITSYDDPLHVLLSKSPVSPNLQKQKKHKQGAPSDPF
ncbi:uncharacterized protein LOC107732796 isoform X2 [Sinocyclocheilus rhinocerous]|uniref:uncharacterized protein LOC107732796 isoform X2 n=1 Tax=Sinocyclocheilus rhinocerous TaxID=307959 RepID=UPI0007B98231|nr:PREDICTED: uncharacterized protein LOC107732796 isoform X2 [Sinocyclocheilus rhinocerous]